MYTFIKAVNMVSGLLIPAGRIRNYQPNLPTSAKLPADERCRNRWLNSAAETLFDLNKLIQDLVVEDKRT